MFGAEHRALVPAPLPPPVARVPTLHAHALACVLAFAGVRTQCLVARVCRDWHLAVSRRPEVRAYRLLATLPDDRFSEMAAVVAERAALRAANARLPELLLGVRRSLRLHYCMRVGGPLRAMLASAEVVRKIVPVPKSQYEALSGDAWIRVTLPPPAVGSKSSSAAAADAAAPRYATLHVLWQLHAQEGDHSHSDSRCVDWSSTPGTANRWARRQAPLAIFYRDGGEHFEGEVEYDVRGLAAWLRDDARVLGTDVGASTRQQSQLVAACMDALLKLADSAAGMDYFDEPHVEACERACGYQAPRRQWDEMRQQMMPDMQVEAEKAAEPPLDAEELQEQAEKAAREAEQQAAWAAQHQHYMTMMPMQTLPPLVAPGPAMFFPMLPAPAPAIALPAFPAAAPGEVNM